MKRFLTRAAPLLVVLLLVFLAWEHGDYWTAVLRDAGKGFGGTMRGIGDSVGSALGGLTK